MKIAYVVTRADSVGGASIHVRDMARGMRERGHDARVLIGGTGPVTDLLTAAGVPWTPIPSLARAVHPLRDWQAFRELRSTLAATGPDLVSAHTSKAGWLGRAAAHSLGLPAIYTPHGWTITDRLGRINGLMYTAAEKLAAPWAERIVCVSEYERNLALAKGVGEPGRLAVIHNGVCEVEPALRASPELSPVRIVSVARFERPKDHFTLLKALADLRALQWELHLVGEGPLEGAIRRRARNLGIENRIHYVGYQREPAGTLAASQIFALASLSEGFPRSVLEAMRAGLPVVASDVGGIREAVMEGHSGYLVPPANSDRFAAALRNLIENAGSRQHMGSSGHHIFEARFRFEQMLRSTLELYDTVTKGVSHR